MDLIKPPYEDYTVRDYNEVSSVVKSMSKTIDRIHDAVQSMNSKLITYNGRGYDTIPDIYKSAIKKGIDIRGDPDDFDDRMFDTWCSHMSNLEATIHSVSMSLKDMEGKELFTKRGLIPDRVQVGITAMADELSTTLVDALRYLESTTLSLQRFLSDKFRVSLNTFNHSLTTYECTSWLTRVANTMHGNHKLVFLHNVSAHILGSSLVHRCDRLEEERHMKYSNFKRFDIFKTSVYDSLGDLYKGELDIVSIDTDNNAGEAIGGKSRVSGSLITKDLIDGMKGIIKQYKNLTKRELCVVLFDWEANSDACEPSIVYTVDSLLSNTDAINPGTGITDEFIQRMTTINTSQFPPYIEPLNIRDVIVLNGSQEYEWCEQLDVIPIRPVRKCDGEVVYQTWGVGDSWARRALIHSGLDDSIEKYYEMYNDVLIDEMMSRKPKSTGMMYRSDIESIISDVNILDIKKAVDVSIANIELPYGSDMLPLVDAIVDSIISALYTYMWDRIVKKKCSSVVTEEISLTFNISTASLVKKFRKEIVDFFQMDKTNMTNLKYVSEHKALVLAIHAILSKSNANIVKLNDRIVQKYYTMYN